VKAGFEVSQRIISTLVNKVEILTTNWHLGQIQFFEVPAKYEYRYLIEGNHKIIYRVDEVKNRILISRVFDTRRDPNRLKV
jgi:plasmid stabilization system protein ParE